MDSLGPGDREDILPLHTRNVAVIVSSHLKFKFSNISSLDIGAFVTGMSSCHEGASRQQSGTGTCESHIKVTQTNNGKIPEQIVTSSILKECLSTSRMKYSQKDNSIAQR